MRNLLLALVVAALLGAGLACAVEAQPPKEAAPAPELKSLNDKVSYVIGLNIGKGMKEQGVSLDLDLLVRGIKDATSGAKPALGEAEIRETMAAFQKEMMAKSEERAKNLAAKNKQEGEAFLTENKKKEGVKTLPSGLQYQVVKEGKGESPLATDTVVVHYSGALLNGTVFDSSYERGEPETLQVNGVIKGWTEALQLMKPGAKWKVFIPAELAYGEEGAGRAIGPNAVLVFDVELLQVKKGGNEKEEMKEEKN